jgi:hypothetical protein
MAALFGAFALTFLLSTAFTDELQLNTSSIERLVTYTENSGFAELLPGALYNGSIGVDWAVPQSALRGLSQKSVAVRVTASLPENSSVFFQGAAGQSREISVYLTCIVANGSCANGSVLSATIPLAASAKPDESIENRVSLRSEIVDAAPPSYLEAQHQGGSILDSLAAMISPNVSINHSNSSIASVAQNVGSGMNITFAMPANGAHNTSGNFLESLKPEGDSHDPLLFLRENPLISIFALIIVILITGTYLLNSKD